MKKPKRGVDKRLNRGINLHIAFSDKTFYLLLGIIAVLIFSGISYASLGGVPNPGHAVSELQTCDEGEMLKTIEGEWACTNATAAGPAEADFSGLELCDEGEILKTVDGEWTCSETELEDADVVTSSCSRIIATGGGCTANCPSGYKIASCVGSVASGYTYYGTKITLTDTSCSCSTSGLNSIYTGVIYCDIACIKIS
jgi:hypothetical protein